MIELGHKGHQGIVKTKSQLLLLSLLLLRNLCLILLLCSGFLSLFHHVSTAKERALQPAPVGYRGYILFSAEIFQVTTQVDRSLAGTNAASFASPCYPLI